MKTVPILRVSFVSVRFCALNGYERQGHNMAYDFVFEGYEFDYFDRVLKIHYYDSERDIHASGELPPIDDDRIKKIEFFVDGITHKAIIMCIRKFYQVLCGPTVEQIKDIRENTILDKTDLSQKQETAIINWKSTRSELHSAERFFWHRLIPESNRYYDSWRQTLLWIRAINSSWINGLTNETIDNLYDEIMNTFVRSKIKTSIMNLSKEDICSKYKEYFEKDGMELEQYKRKIEEHFSNEISNFVLRNLNAAKKELIMKEVSSKYGTYFENEDTELESYKNGIDLICL